MTADRSTAPLTSGFRLRINDSGRLCARHYEVVVVAGPDAGKRATLDGELMVGSHRDCGFLLNDQTVSRQHLVLEARPEGVLVRDLDSFNGTLLAGARVDQVIVETEASVQIGRTVLKIRIWEEDEGDANEGPTSFGEAVGESRVMRRLFALLQKVAVTDATVLLTGETGTGKEILAKAVHAASPRARKAFVVVDCGALSGPLIESELFGHAKGAFTDAAQARVGAFVAAQGGTIFLDEVGELPLELQPKLLRALEAKTVRPVGSDEAVALDVRIVAATHRNLETEAQAGRFRKDLFYRLSAVMMTVPPLREREADVELLAKNFVRKLGPADFQLSDGVLALARTNRWDGNVRELRNFIERALAGIALDDAPTPNQAAKDLTFREAKEKLLAGFTREYLAALSKRCDGNVSEMSRSSGIARSHLNDLLSRYGLKT